jgi:acetolactate synthase-1/3 small subunit
MHIISALVENKPGVLYRVSNMFRARGFNINSLTVGPTEQSDLSRVTVTLADGQVQIDQVVKQLAKLIDVVSVDELPLESAVYKELALVKLAATDPNARGDVASYASLFNGKIVDVSPEAVTIELVDTPDKIDAFVKIVSGIGIREMSRTGVTAMRRG